MASPFKTIPQPLRVYFASEGVTALVGAISEQAGIREHGALAGVIFRLITKDITVYDFISVLATDIGISDARAKAIAKETKERIFESQRNALFVWGIDISAIHVLDAPPLESFHLPEDDVQLPASTPPKSERPVLLDAASMQVSAVKPVPVTPPSPRPPLSFRPIQPVSRNQAPAPAPAGNASPLILHEENRVPLREPVPAQKKRFFFPMNFLKPKPAAQPSVVARIETPGASVKPSLVDELHRKEPERKVVFYGSARTELPPAAKDSGQPSVITNQKTFPRPVPTPPPFTASPASLPGTAPAPFRPEAGPVPLSVLIKPNTSAPAPSPKITPPSSPRPFVNPPSAYRPLENPSSASPHISGNTIDLRGPAQPPAAGQPKPAVPPPPAK